ncbi:MULTISPECIES: M64 family metallopeptidase [Thermomonosporaceae]|uniref:M64 family metallopeptidase n=1 Tax=Thermomonosporaceae TaxID=2012 RepID=UPI00255B29C3|nr:MULTISPECIES: M64 family metallopeptidase [Thermomonosporaceae]MDL4773502.1 M64 family metallopeptidase [Actinomadura xylanilytica]
MPRAESRTGRGADPKVRKITAAVLSAAVPLTMLAAPPPAAAGTAPAMVVPIQVTGDPAKRFNLVVMGDGYTAADMPAFRADLDRHLNDLWALEPFKSYRSYVNVYAVEITSPESGVSCDPELSAPHRTTPLSMAFRSGCEQDGLQRLLVMDSDAAKTYADLVKGTGAGNPDPGPDPARPRPQGRQRAPSSAA